MGEIVLEIPARPAYVALARQVVAAAASIEAAFRDERIDDLRIAVSEATTNAIEAHADLSSDERVIIRANLATDRIEVQVLDQGAGFEPDDDPDLPDPLGPGRLQDERGLGLPLIRVLADEAEVIPSAGGTRVRLVVYRSPRREA